MTPRELFNQLYLSTHRRDSHSRWVTEEASFAEDDILLQYDGQGKAIAGMVMQPVGFMYHGTMLDAVKMTNMSNLRDVRGRAAALQLNIDALAAARDRGKALCVIVPPQRHLYFYYDRFGYSTVLYADELRYTALHTFAGGCGELTEPTGEILRHLEMAYGCGTIHTDGDFKAMRQEIAARGDTRIIAARDGNDSGMIIAESYDDNVAVRLCLADSECLRLHLLWQLRQHEPDKTFLVDTPPVSDDRNYLRSRGMVRIVNPLPLLCALAASDASLRHIIRLRDALIPDNEGYYLIADGNCLQMGDSSTHRPDLEVDISTLTAILFSSPTTGRIFNLPTVRPLLT